MSLAWTKILLPTTMLELMFWALFLVWIFKYVIPGLTRNPEKKSSWIPPMAIGGMTRGMVIAISLFFLSSIVAIFVSPNRWQALGLWRAYFLEPMIFFFILLHTLSSPTRSGIQNNEMDSPDGHRGNDILSSKFSAQGGSASGGKIENLVWPLSISVFYISLIAILQRFFGLAIPAPWQGELRVTSIFEYPNAVGLFVAPILPLILWLAFTHRRPEPAPNAGEGSRKIYRFFATLRTMVLGIIMALGVITIILAKSDGAIVGLLAGLALALLIYNRRSRLALAILIVAAIFGILFVPQIQSWVGEKALMNDWSGYVRKTIWTESWDTLKDNPFFGAGLGGYPTVFTAYHRVQGIEIFLYPHSIFLNPWSELGILGLIAFLWMMVGFIRMSFPRWPSGESRMDIWIPAYARMTLIKIAALSSMITLLVHGLVDVPYFKNDLAFLFWTIYAIPFILPENENSDKIAK